MDKTAILCDQDRDLLYEFSRRTIERLTGHHLGGTPIPFVTGYVEDNVDKEVKKDRLVIEGASAACASGISGVDVDALFEATKAVDSMFISRLVTPSLSVKVRYEEIEETRKQRIRLISDTVMRLLQGWSDTMTFEDRLRETYPEQELRATLTDILHLYNLETRVLTRSVGFMRFLDPAVRLVSGVLFGLMEEVSREMIDDCLERIYGKTPHHV